MAQKLLLLPQMLNSCINIPFNAARGLIISIVGKQIEHFASPHYIIATKFKTSRILLAVAGSTA